MALEIIGILHSVSATQQITDTFSKRDFVLDLTETAANGQVYTNYAQMQMTNQGCGALDNFNIGEQVKVTFNIKGSRVDKDGQVRYFNNLNAFRIERTMPATSPSHIPSSQQPQQNYGQPQFQHPNNTPDDLPF